MRKKIILFISVIAVLIAIIISFFIINETKKIKTNVKIKLETNPYDIKINKFRLQQIFENSDNKWILKAENGQIFRDRNIAKCIQSKVTFIKKNKKIATLHAPKTIFYLKEDKIEMEGGIKSRITNNTI